MDLNDTGDAYVPSAYVDSCRANLFIENASTDERLRRLEERVCELEIYRSYTKERINYANSAIGMLAFCLISAAAFSMQEASKKPGSEEFSKYTLASLCAFMFVVVGIMGLFFRSHSRVAAWEIYKNDSKFQFDGSGTGGREM